MKMEVQQIIQPEITASLPVMEAFYTLQGEGHHQCKAAYFIRHGGCDVGCVWCDVKDSWDAGKHPLFNIEDLILNVQKTPAEIVVITGGEPFLHDLTELTRAAIVIGPTPPGTGVMNEHFGATFLKTTSPASR